MRSRGRDQASAVVAETGKWAFALGYCDDFHEREVGIERGVVFKVDARAPCGYI